MNFKDIHIGQLIKTKVIETEGSEQPNSRICNFMKSSEEDIQKMYEAKSLDSEILLRWSKLLEYDFFRIYSQHLILFAPQSNNGLNQKAEKKKSQLPQFRKNIYTKEVIDFILELIEAGEKTKSQVIEEYRIPKTTLYKWIKKHKK